jgi:hypothetical protein
MRCGQVLVVMMVCCAGEALAQSDQGSLLAPTIGSWQQAQPATRHTSAPPGAIDMWQAPQTQTAGLQAGAFTIFPSVTAGILYDDNVFAASTNRQSDWAYIVRPELIVRSEGTQHAVEANALVAAREYSSFKSENQTDAAAGVRSTFLLDPDTRLRSRLQYIYAHEERGVAESVFQRFDRPVAYSQSGAAAMLDKRLGRWWTSVGAAALWLNFENPTILGVPIDLSFRDGDVVVVPVRVGYVVAPQTSLFVEAAGNRRDWRVDAFDSRGYRVVGGVLLEPAAGLGIKGEAFAGYMFQDYAGATFQTLSTWTFGASITVALMRELTATVEGRREALESGLNGGVSLIETSIGARADYMILPKLAIGAGMSLVVDEFSGANRTDYNWRPLAAVKFLLHPQLTVGLDYRRQNFDSSGVNVPSFYRSIYLFSLSARL